MKSQIIFNILCGMSRGENRQDQICIGIIREKDYD